MTVVAFFGHDEGKLLLGQIGKAAAIGIDRPLNDDFCETCRVHGADAHDAAYRNKFQDDLV